MVHRKDEFSTVLDTDIQLRRHTDVAKGDLKRSPDTGGTTVHELMQNTFKKNAGKKCMGTRRFIEEKKFPGERNVIKVFGETNWISYEELGKRSEAFGKALISLGMKPQFQGLDLQEASSQGHTMLIFEETCEPWMTALIGASGQSICVATSYATLGISAVAEAIEECHVSLILCNHRDVERVVEATKGSMCLKTIVYTMNNVAEGAARVEDSQFKILSFDEVIEMGKNVGDQITYSEPTPETLAVVMYTSGSTGKPKGVMVAHENIVGSVAGLTKCLFENKYEEGNETYLAYLPTAHILELAAEMTMLSTGQMLGYADPKTISSKGACRMKDDGNYNREPGWPYPPGAIQEFRPSGMAGVPKIWDIFKKGVEEGVQQAGNLKKTIFNQALKHPKTIGKVVFKRFKAMLGGNMKLGLSGGGSIAADLQNFIYTVFGIHLIQGYGLTETSCAGAVQRLPDTRVLCVGGPLVCVEIRLRSCLDENNKPEVLDRTGRPYLVTDTDHFGEAVAGRGEVWIRGPPITKGYFKRPDLTRESYVDGWFKTGDVAVWTPDGALKIVDRLKNLIKLKGGEYVAIEAMEKEYSTSVYASGVNGGVMVYADSDMDRPVAFVQASASALEKWASRVDEKFTDIEDLCKKPKAEQEVLNSLVSIGKGANLASHELIVAVGLISGTGPATELTVTSPWTPENQGLTAANKLNRRYVHTSLAEVLQPLKAKGIR